MKKIIKKLTPHPLLSLYHILLAASSALLYGRPSRKMIVIGITGTKGKTSAANFLWSALNAAGKKTGLITTANIRIGDKEILNAYHMTMPGRFAIQKLMAEMLKEHCTFCIVETTSEGLKQFRHVGIHYDIAVFTNLTPEHLTSHNNSFDAYKNMKGKLFKTLSKTLRKNIEGEVIPKVIIANADSPHSPFFLQFHADKKIAFGVHGGSIRASSIVSDEHGVNFTVNNNPYKLSMLGEFNVYNALPAIVVAELFNLPHEKVSYGLKALTLIPGRMEKIEAGQPYIVIVDYAHEKASMTALLETAKKIKKPDSKIIVLLGAEGGGRDKRKRPEMGQVAADYADFVVVSNVDPYEDDPTQIIEDIAKASETAGKIRGQNLFTIEDRRAGIAKALSLAQKNDIVLLTGKGAEQSMIINGQVIPWDDRNVVREEIAKLMH